MTTILQQESPMLAREPLSKEAQKRILDEFNTSGAARVGRFLSDAEVADFRRRIDEVFSDPAARERDTLQGDMVASRLFEWGHLFRDVAVREPLITLAEALLGADCHLIANNCIRNRPGRAIDKFHVDDFVWLPLPPEVERHDPRMTFPTYLVNCHIALTDIDAEEFGPLQYVPGSHCSGREPNDTAAPSFLGKRHETLFARAGDLYIQHPQVWHRGAPNVSTRTRYVIAFTYGKRFISHRFYPFMNYRVPDSVLEGAGERLLRVLGKHKKGAYG